MAEREYYYDDQWHSDPEEDPYVPSDGPTNWTDPDNPPPTPGHGWLYDQTQPPTQDPGPGNYWNWNGSQWEVRSMPRANNPTGPTGPGPANPPPPGPSNPNPTFNYSSAWPDGSDFKFTPYESYGPFQYDPFTPTNYEDLFDESQNPGFMKAQDRLSKQVQNSAAYRGMLRSGMTIGDLSSVLDTNAMQKFAEFDNRRYRNWSGNLGLARDRYAFGAAENERRNNFRFNIEDREFQAILQRWRTLVDTTKALATSPV